MSLNKSLTTLLFGLFLVMTGFGMTLPVLPFYIEQISIADGVTQNKLWMHVGLITGIYPFVQFLISPSSWHFLGQDWKKTTYCCRACRICSEHFFIWNEQRYFYALSFSFSFRNIFSSIFYFGPFLSYR